MGCLNIYLKFWTMEFMTLIYTETFHSYFGTILLFRWYISYPVLSFEVDISFCKISSIPVNLFWLLETSQQKENSSPVRVSWIIAFNHYFDWTKVYQKLETNSTLTIKVVMCLKTWLECSSIPHLFSKLTTRWPT